MYMRFSATVGLFAAAAAVACVGAGSVGATDAAFHSVVTAKLVGTTEAPQKGSPAGSGTARITLNAKTGKACWTLSVKGIGLPLSAHVHKAPPGKAGPVVIPLGARWAKKGCVISPKKTIIAVATNPRGYYVNVHTKKYLNGALRGQLRAG